MYSDDLLVKEQGQAWGQQVVYLHLTCIDTELQ